MKLIILYGAPAVGKLTVAKELTKITDAKLFDNHQLIDMVEPLVTRKYAGFTELIYETQKQIMVAAAKADQSNIVFTFSYAANDQAGVDFLTDLISGVRAEGSEVYPILLKCSDETLRKRVIEPSRSNYGKVTSLETMNSFLKSYNFNEPLNVEGGIVLQTDESTPTETAKSIQKHIS